MAAHSFSDTAVETALSSGISAAATEIQVGSVSGFPITYPYYLDIDYGSVTLEVVEVISGAGTTLTVTRGASTTSAIGHSSGAIVRHVAPAEHYESVEAHAEATSAVHGVTGSVVGTTDAQELSNKSMSGDDNTFTDIPQSAVTGLVSELGDIDTAIAAVDTLIDNHIADTVDAHDASAISFSPAGTIAASTVQAAIEELDSGSGLDAWTDYTPTITQNGAVAKTVNYARYNVDGKSVRVQVYVSITGSGTAANIVTVSLPVTAATGGLLTGGGFLLYDSSSPTPFFAGVTVMNTSTSVKFLCSGTSQYLGANGGSFTAGLASGDILSFDFDYEAA